MDTSANSPSKGHRRLPFKDLQELIKIHSVQSIYILEVQWASFPLAAEGPAAESDTQFSIEEEDTNAQGSYVPYPFFFRSNFGREGPLALHCLTIEKQIRADS